MRAEVVRPEKGDGMNVNGVSGTGYTPLPTFQDMAAILAARSAMAEMSTKAANQAVVKADDAAAATGSASAAADGKVDMYL
jgi:hypothetical protein